MAGSTLKQLIQEQSVCFYVSPFARSRQTYQQIRQSFNDEQVWWWARSEMGCKSCIIHQVLHVREDPRIREQEWGNFQDPSIMQEAMDERRKVGSFYYRFLTGER
jgi:broad specificity phosphatase PhoE